MIRVWKPTAIIHTASRLGDRATIVDGSGTTVTFAAQLFSMPNSAESPPKFAPYPTLVGTAMTGQAT